MTKEEIINEAEKIQGWMSHEELGLLYDLAKEVLEKDSLAVEVGSWKGRSAYVIGHACKEKGAKLICIDTFCGCESQKFLYEESMKKGIEKFIDDNIAKNMAGLPVDFVVGNSIDIQECIVNGSLSFCFIDGDHFNPGVKQDLDNFWPKVKMGGIFAGHDYSNEFAEVVKEVNTKFPDIIRREIKFTIWLVRKE
jgi:predicted O-methyltransferase YrrM